MASLPPRPEDQRGNAGRPRFEVPPDESLPAGAGPWLVTYVEGEAERAAAVDICDLEIPGLLRVARPLAAALDHVGAYPGLVIIDRLDNEDIPVSTRRVDLRQVGSLILRYGQAGRPELQHALTGEVQYHEARAVQVIAHRQDLNDPEWRAAIGQCYQHPVDWPEKDRVDLFAPYFGRLSLARPLGLSTANEVADQVADAIDYLAGWRVAPEHAGAVVRTLGAALREVEDDDSKPTIHRPLPDLPATALELVLTRQYDTMLNHHRNPQRRKAQQENIARMARETVLPKLERDVPGLRRPDNFRVRHLFRLYTAAKLLSNL